MKLDRDDPRLIDFALGELEPKEAADIEAALEAPENAGARAAVEELRNVARLAEAALVADNSAEMAEQQRDAVLRAAEGRRNVRQRSTQTVRRPRFRWGAACTVALFAGAASFLAYHYVSPLYITIGDATTAESALARNMDAPAPIAEGITYEHIEEEVQHQIFDSSRVEGNTPAPVHELESIMRGQAQHAPTLDVSPSESIQAPPEGPRSEATAGVLVQPIDSGIMKDSDNNRLGGEQPVAERKAPSPPPPLVSAASASKGPEKKAISGGLQEVKVEGAIRIRGNYYAPPAEQVGVSGGARGYGVAGRGGGGGYGGGGYGDARSGDFRGDYETRERISQRIRELSEYTTGTDGSQPGQSRRLGVEVHDLALSYDANGDGVDEAIPFYTRPDGSPATDLYEDLGFNGVWYWREEAPEAVKYFGESYAAIQENAFMPVAQQPLSTFSIDVDTAAYANVRRFLNDGHLPPVHAVRIEELINYFDYAYPEPDTSRPLSAQVEIGPCPWTPQHRLAKVGLHAKDIVREERPPCNLVFLLDVSGSMKGAKKLPLLREAMKALVNELDEGDTIGIVSYSNEAEIVLDPTSCVDKETILKNIDCLCAKGGTNGGAGIEEAYAMAKKARIEGGVNRVLLGTDGDFNVGTTDRQDLLELITESARSKVFLSVLGFGTGNIKDANLEMLADKGNGHYAYIDSFAEARRVLVDQAGSTLVTVAKDVKLQVEFNPTKVGAYRLIGYENRLLAAQDFNDDRKDAGDIGAGHTVTALYEIVPAGQSPQPGVDPLKYQPAPPVEESSTEYGDETMTVKLRYKHPEGDRSTKFEVPVTDGGRTMNAASSDFRHAAAVAAYGLLLRQSRYRGNASWPMVLDLAESAKSSDAERQAFIDLAVTAKTLTSP